jgi:hypothetical protein
MTRVVGGSLSPALLARLSQRDLPGRLGMAITFVTVDPAGRPHPMLVSYLEVRAHDAGTLGLVIGAASRSGRNLVDRRAGTLALVEPDLIAYIKARHAGGPVSIGGGEHGLGYFRLEIEEVLEDAAADWEAGMRITSPARYAPVPDLEAPWARATLAALARPPVALADHAPGP